MERMNIFIGSTQEQFESLAYSSMKSLVKKFANPVGWKDIDTAGEFFLNSLIECARNVDFAVFLLTGDDFVESRGVSYLAPRDNILYEVGLFMGILPMGRTYIIYDKDDKAKIPTDLSGLSRIEYNKIIKKNTTDIDWGASFISVGNDLKRAISKRGPKIREEIEFALGKSKTYTFENESFLICGPEWNLDYPFKYNGRLAENSPGDIDIGRGVSLYWLAHDMLWTVIALKSGQPPQQISRGLTMICWQMEQSGYSYHASGTYGKIRNFALDARKNRINTAFWTQDYKHKLASYLLVQAHHVGISLNEHIINCGPKNYLPLPPWPGKNDVQLKRFLIIPDSHPKLG